MNNTDKYLISVLSAALDGRTVAEPPSDFDEKRFYRQAKFHSIACAVYETVSNSGFFSAQLVSALEKQYMQNALQQSNRDYEVEGLFRFCREKQIRLMPLKGWYLRRLYPDPLMRSSSDADIYADPSDFPAISEYFVSQCDFIEERDSEQHIGFLKPPYVNIELHYSLVKAETAAPAFGFCSPFEHSHKTDEGEFVYCLNPEDFYVYMITHMIKHLHSGGFGLRSVADVRLFNLKYKLNRDYIKSELDKANLSTAEAYIRKLSELWFGCEASVTGNEVTDELAEFIMNSGVFGSIEHEAAITAATVDGSITKKRTKSLLSKAFPSLGFMRVYYRWLRGAGCVLLPVGWIARLFSAMFKRRNWKRLRAIGDTDTEASDSARKLFEKLELM